MKKKQLTKRVALLEKQIQYLLKIKEGSKDEISPQMCLFCLEEMIDANTDMRTKKATLIDSNINQFSSEFDGLVYKCVNPNCSQYHELKTVGFEL